MFYITCPTAAFWIEQIERHREQLLKPVPQMTALLEAVRRDVDLQFDENQSKWQPLAEYTVLKKQELGADPRILHETKVGEGLRLRDAYMQTGTVTDEGILIYTYPVEKPYAQDLQEGVIDNKERPERTSKKKQKGLSWRQRKELEALDEDFERRFRRK